MYSREKYAPERSAYTGKLNFALVLIGTLMFISLTSFGIYRYMQYSPDAQTVAQAKELPFEGERAPQAADTQLFLIQ